MESLKSFLNINKLTDKSISEQKKFLRSYLLQKREKEFNSFKNKRNWGKSQFINTLKKLNLPSQNELEKNFRVACFFPIRGELNFLPYVQSNWLFPKVSSQTLLWFEYGDGHSQYTLNRWKIPEKKIEYCFEYTPEDKPLLCFTPGLAGDSRGNRIGYGRGYYDKFFAQNNNITSILCLPSEDYLFDNLPCNPHDQTMTHIIT